MLLLNAGLNFLRLKSEPLQRMRKAMLVLTQRVFSPTSRLLAAATLQNTLNQTLAHPLYQLFDRSLTKGIVPSVKE
jgi:hypothetical protein